MTAFELFAIFHAEIINGGKSLSSFCSGLREQENGRVFASILLFFKEVVCINLARVSTLIFEQKNQALKIQTKINAYDNQK